MRFLKSFFERLDLFSEFRRTCEGPFVILDFIWFESRLGKISLKTLKIKFLSNQRAVQPRLNGMFRTEEIIPTKIISPNALPVPNP